MSWKLTDEHLDKLKKAVSIIYNKKYNIPGFLLDEEDLFHYAALRLNKYIDNYDKSKCSLDAFIWRNAVFGTVDAIRHESSNYNRLDSEPYSKVVKFSDYESSSDDEDKELFQIEDTDASPEVSTEYDDLILAIANTLKDRYRDIFLARIRDHKTMPEIAKEHGVTTSRIAHLWNRKIIPKIKKVLSTVIPDEYLTFDNFTKYSRGFYIYHPVYDIYFTSRKEKKVNKKNDYSNVSKKPHIYTALTPVYVEAVCKIKSFVDPPGVGVFTTKPNEWYVVPVHAPDKKFSLSSFPEAVSKLLPYDIQ